MFSDNEERRFTKTLDFVDLWNRPDIAEKAIFNLGNINNLNTLQNPEVYISFFGKFLHIIYFLCQTVL